MTLKCRFFSDGSEYHQPDFAKLMLDSIGDGYVRDIGNELEVVAATPYNMTVEVGTGRGYIQGYSFDVEDTTYSVPIAAADPDNPRIDRIVARLSVTQNRNITLIDLQGVPSASPEPPELTRDTETYDISLAQVLVEAGASSVPSANITDERNIWALCGVAGQKHGWFDTTQTVQIPVEFTDIEEGVQNRDPVIMMPNGKWRTENSENANGVYYADAPAVVINGVLDGYTDLEVGKNVNAIAFAISQTSALIRGTIPDDTFTFIVNQGVSDPSQMITYSGYSAMFTETERKARIERYVRPCVVKNATRVYYLDPTDLTKKVDGTAADLTGIDGDVCLEIPTCYVRYLKKSDTQMEVSFTFTEKEGYSPYAHRYGDRVASYIWLGMFEATGSTCASIYSATAKPAVSKKLSAFRTEARAKGSALSENTYNPMLVSGWTLYQTLVLYCLGTPATQQTVGNGNVSTSASLVVGSVAGSTTDWLTGGAWNGSTSVSNQGVQALWMVNPWGNVYKFLDGIEFYGGNAYISVLNNEGHDIEAGYSNVPATWLTVPTGLATNVSGQYTTLMGFTEYLPWFPMTTGGTSATYWCDGCYSAATDDCCVVGGHWGGAALAGLFVVYVNHGVASSNANFGARLQIHSLD